METDQKKIAIAIQESARQSIKNHRGVFSFFDMDVLDSGMISRYPAYIDRPYCMPYLKANACQMMPGDEVCIPTYDIGSSMDWKVSSRPAIVSRGLEVFTSSFIDKIDNDAISLLIAASAIRVRHAISFVNLLKKFIIENNDNSEQPILVFVDYKMFDKLCKKYSSENRNRLNIEFMDHNISIFGIQLKKDIKCYTSFWKRLITMPFSSPVIIAQNNHDGFVMPIKQEVTVFDDPKLNPLDRIGIYGWMEFGLGVLNPQDVMLGFCY